MSDAKSNALEVSVSELSGKLKRTVEDTFGHVRVRGEISGYRGPHSSGHSYFSLKDDKARMDAIIWRGQAAKLKHLPEEGLEVIASGKLTTYPGQSKYQIVIDALEPAGAGALMALLEERRHKLQAEGLFAEERKQLLPYMPKVIGVITSPTGAVIRDILHRISDRFPVHVIVWPVRVQGDTCGREVANALEQFNTFGDDGALPRPDLLIVARGGGSLEDLWGFNDEEAVRAVANSMIPVISAVGHETDWTLIDHASDWRAPTPTAAAEKAVPVRADLEAFLADLGGRLRGAMRRNLDNQRKAVDAAARGIASPDMMLALPRRRFDEAASRLGMGLERRVEIAGRTFANWRERMQPILLERRWVQARDRLVVAERDHGRALLQAVAKPRARLDAIAARVQPNTVLARLERASARFDIQAQALPRLMSQSMTERAERVEKSQRLLNTLSYKSIIARGFAVVKNSAGNALMKASDVEKGMALTLEMEGGSVEAVAGSGRFPAPTAAVKKQKKDAKSDDQGKLF